MILFQAIVLGALQGLTELFPVSSLGHSVLLPHVLGWHLAESSNAFVIFLVATHLATSIVLFAFYGREWRAIIVGMFRSLARREIAPEDRHAKVGWLLVVATVPAGILGLLFEDSLKKVFASPVPVSVFLAANGLMLLLIEYRKRRTKKAPAGGNAPETSDAATLSWWQGLRIGFSQCLALLPGFSRTGSTLGGGLLVGLSHEEAAHFSFLLATPIIFAASVLKLPELWSGYSSHDVLVILVGSACSAVAAYVAVRFLSRYFRTKTLVPFGAYCLVAGLASLAYFLF